MNSSNIIDEGVSAKKRPLEKINNNETIDHQGQVNNTFRRHKRVSLSNTASSFPASSSIGVENFTEGSSSFASKQQDNNDDEVEFLFCVSSESTTTQTNNNNDESEVRESSEIASTSVKQRSVADAINDSSYHENNSQNIACLEKVLPKIREATKATRNDATINLTPTRATSTGSTTAATVTSRCTPDVAGNFKSRILSKSKQTQPFSYRSSAYLQCLAEICHDILWDLRWRVNDKTTTTQSRQQRRLFAWEYGEDMSALFALSRRYILPSAPIEDSKHQSSSTTASVSATNPISNPTDSLTHTMTASEEEDVSLPSSHPNSNLVNNDATTKEELYQHKKDDLEQESEEDLDRCLEIYCRLYFRKGPWYRLDNIYSSYYVPKKDSLQQSLSSNESQSQEEESSSATNMAKKSISPSKFFLPTSHSKTRTNNKNNGGKKLDNYIDEDYINQQMDSVTTMLQDIRRLLKMGLIRTFESEEECGMTVGKTGKYCYSSATLLRQDEQRIVLAMLGGQKQKRLSGSNSSSYNRSNSFSSSTPTSAVSSSENLIWKQMCQQHTISHSFMNSNDEKEDKKSQRLLLPIIKHVHEILIEKLASIIVLKASKLEFIPSSVLRTVKSSLTVKLVDLISNYSNAICGNRPIRSIMCIRLREAPILTLRRACRLYLCATSGPGDMRGDGSNAWRSLPGSNEIDLQRLPMKTNIIPPPGSNSWHTITYPGKDWRLRLTSCNFIRAFRPILTEDFHCTSKGTEGSSTQVSDTYGHEQGNTIHVFADMQEFHRWEASVDLRATGDYLLELNDLLLYTERKSVKEQENTISSSVEYDDTVESCAGSTSSDDETDSFEEKRVDFLHLLTIEGRAKFIRKFVMKKDKDTSLFRKIEQDVSNLLGLPVKERTLSALAGMSTPEILSSTSGEKCRLRNECERVLGVISIMLIHILQDRNFTATEEDVSHITARPWLRHMCWEGCMAYLLWDMIPVLERRGYYRVAIDALEVLLFGILMPRKGPTPDSLVQEPDVLDRFVLANCFLSRRARGKAYERLIIDYIHTLRRDVKKTKQALEKCKTVKIPKKSKSKKKNTPYEPTANDLIASLIDPLLKAHAVTGRITFSATRMLAKRLKRPLSQTFHGLRLFETSELGHRLCNGTDMQIYASKYSDWSPVTDTTVANAMSSDQSSVGARCSFIGFEDDEHDTVYLGSLNVEELAKEYYHQGRLPSWNEPSSVKGGWVGYHDEGGKIRALFRILSSNVLGMDCAADNCCDSFFDIEGWPTIHLTPYQGAPFDLHVGAEILSTGNDRTMSSNRKSNGIYIRRRVAIDDFLTKLSNLQGQTLADFVYDSINSRLQHTKTTNHIDPSLDRDLKQARTLSMLAVGFGGKMLARIFRCLFFDYRHYSGGLPDLLLFRALFSSGELVNLGEWVGETFSKEYQSAMKAEQIAHMFGDKDDEFLGCSKVGDSGGRFNRSSRQTRRGNVTPHQSQGEKSSGDKSHTTDDKLVMPDRLQLHHNGQPVQVECMCVEVKSQNDRLDPRQEDWLNILDLDGNARVCKFTKPDATRTTRGRTKKANKKAGVESCSNA